MASPVSHKDPMFFRGLRELTPSPPAMRQLLLIEEEQEPQELKDVGLVQKVAQVGISEIAQKMEKREVPPAPANPVKLSKSHASQLVPIDEC